MASNSQKLQRNQPTYIIPLGEAPDNSSVVGSEKFFAKPTSCSLVFDPLEGVLNKSSVVGGGRFFAKSRFGKRRNISPSLGKLRTISLWWAVEDFSPNRDLKGAGILCVFQALQTEELAENIR